jgi:hypothetical protein
MANSTNDDMDRIGNRNTPQGGTSQDTFGQTGSSQQGRDTMDRDFEADDSTGRDSGISGTRESELDRNRNTSGTDFSRNSGRGPDDISE